jgi:hypothetical protein
MALDEALLSQLTDPIEVNGTQVPMREHPFFKEPADFKTFAKVAFDAHREVGARIPLKVDPTKPETIDAWKKENLPKLQKAGVLPTPLAREQYKIAKPEKLIEGIGWNDVSAGKLGDLAHKHGISQEAVDDLLKLQEEHVSTYAKVLNTQMDSAMAALKAEHGDKFDERSEMTKRLTAFIFKNPEELQWFEDTGIGNHPTFLGVLMRLAPFAQQDSSFMKDLDASSGTQGVPQMTQDDLRKELARVQSDKTHPMHEDFLRRTTKYQEWVDALYKRQYGDGKVSL